MQKRKYVYIWAVCTDIVLAMSPAFSLANEFGIGVFVQVRVTDMVINHKQKIPSQVYIALSKSHTNCTNET